MAQVGHSVMNKVKKISSSYKKLHSWQMIISKKPSKNKNNLKKQMKTIPIPETSQEESQVVH